MASKSASGKYAACKESAEPQKDILHHYSAVRDGKRPPNFHLTRAWKANGAPENFPDPWNAHAQALDALLQSGERTDCVAEQNLFVEGPDHSGNSSLLDLKISLAHQMLDDCDLCPHHCHVNRNEGKTGFCGVADQTAVHWEGVLHGEEIELMASHEVFLSGCTMRCAFCYSHAHITRPMSGLPMAPQEIAACVNHRYAQGSSNLNLVGGEPTVHIPNILRMLREVAAPLPVVWNSNMYATPQAMALLDGVVDLFLGDIHFGNEACAQRLGLIPDYLPSVKAAFLAAAASQADVIIRHLVMPGHLDCCARPAMEWATDALPETPFHLMFQYVPDFRAARDPVLGRFVSPEEICRAKEMAREIGVNLYVEPNGGEVRSPPNTAETTGTRTSPVQVVDIGQAVDIIIQGDGRVSFARLLPELLPIAAALDAGDLRVQTRTGLLGCKK